MTVDDKLSKPLGGFETVARAVRIEIDPTTNDMYLVFRIIDERFKRKVRENWNNDIPVEVQGLSLVERK
jgi:hypothetical protein